MNDPKHPLSSEPGRRYATGRTGLRPDVDVSPRTVPRSTTQPELKQRTPLTQPSNQKHLDFAPQHTSRKPSTTKPALPRQNRSHVLKRHMVERAVEYRKEARSMRKRRFAGFIGMFMIIGALLVILWSFWDFFPNIRSISIPYLHDTRHGNTAATASTKNLSTLDESIPTPTDLTNFQAAADAPRILRISKLDVEARVKRVGASLVGEPISPSNIHDVGWFDDSGRPGQPGAVLINGHISGSTKNGVFHDLQSLLPNDEIVIERGDKTIITYSVVKVQTFTGDQVDMSIALDSIDSSKNGLNLVTSSANYDGGNNQNIQRVIVFAVQR